MILILLHVCVLSHAENIPLKMAFRLLWRILSLELLHANQAARERLDGGITCSGIFFPDLALNRPCL